jgi:diguanylate cyclase (GGDEF)-like protein/PAS domain S-box-containing protein
MKKIIKLLLIADNPDDTLFIREILSEVRVQQFNIIVVTTLVAARTLLNNESVDVILLDLKLSDNPGFKTFSLVSQMVFTTPIIVLTGLTDEKLGMKAVKAGAQDYLIKNEISATLLARSIIYGIERKRIEHDLKIFSAIVEYADEAIYVRNFKGIVTSWNKAAERIFGYKAAEIIGKNISLLYSEKDLADESYLINSKIQRGESIIDYETLRKTKDKGVIHTSFTFAPLHDDTKRIVAVVVIGRDITQQKKYEKILALEHRISIALSLATTLDHSASSILKTICEIFEWEVGELWILDAQRQHFQCISGWTASEKYQKFIDLRKQSLRNIDDNSIHAIMEKTHQIYLSNDLLNETVVTDKELIREMNFRCCIGLPIMFKDQFLGIILFLSTQTHVMDPNLLSVLKTIGEEMGVFITQNSLEDELSYQLHYDALTGLLNKTSLQESFFELATKAKKENHLVALIFLDLDNFKKINDTMGHALGDIILKDVAARLKKTFRAHDVIGRISGDEFVLIVSEIKNITELDIISQKILHVISQPYHIEQTGFLLTASIGVSIYPTDGENFETILRNADIAMYVAKKEGGNNIKICNPILERELQHTVSLENALFNALNDHEFVMYYQPIIDAKTGKIVCLEALIRWQHKTDGLLLPMEFIPLAEAIHLIIPIGDWVLKTVIEQTKKFHAYDKTIYVAVNLSASQLRAPNFLKKITELIQQYPEVKNLIEIELTEGILMETISNNIYLLQAIREVGVKISIDDFGTGYSSFIYLQNYIADLLKIDQSFVAALGKQSKAEAIVKSMISIAHNLGMLTVAEGVETKEQADFLIANDCDRLQGYYFGKPMPSEEICNLLNPSRSHKCQENRQLKEKSHK